MDEKSVVIMRGISGAGKTTYHSQVFPGAFCCSANDFFTDVRGKYKFYKNGQDESHKYCRYAFRAALRNNLPLIVVDNTHVNIWEFMDYIEMAEDHSYGVTIIRINADPIIAAQRTIHGVPSEHIMRMYNRMETFTHQTIEEKIIEDSTFSLDLLMS